MRKFDIQDSVAGKTISAYIILDKHGKCVGTVRAWFGDGGSCYVNVNDYGKTNKDGSYTEGKGVQYGQAGGYGYDKFTAALSGLSIDGIAFTDHCGESAKPPKEHGWPYSPNMKPPKGFHFANRREIDGVDYYTDCYRQPGLKILEEFGYRVLRAI